MILDNNHLADIRRRKNRYMGQWTGTAGSLAADCHHLMEDRKEMAATIEKLEQENADLRRAVEDRLAGGSESCCDGGPCHPQAIVDEPASIPVDWILRGQAELKSEQQAPRFRGDSIIAAPVDEDAPAAERLLLTALEVIRDRRPKYGGPKKHFARTVGMINAAFAEVLKRPLTEADWAVIMTLDKVARYMGPSKTSDGPVDLAGYAACLAEVEALP
jgi:hypothetical protein